MLAVSDVFAEGALPFPDKWYQATITGCSGMVTEGNAVVGFKDANASAKRLIYSAVKILPKVVTGDFTATAKLQYATKDNKFTGNALVQFLDEKGNFVAEVGLRDHWSGAPGQLYSRVAGSSAKAAVAGVPFDGVINLKIERIGEKFMVSGNKRIILETKGVKSSIGKVMLFFDTYQGTNGEHFGRFEFSNIEVKPYDAASFGSFESFSETPKTGFSPEWQLVHLSGAKGLATEAGAPYYTVTGFVGPDAKEKKSYTAIYDRPLGKLSGDFTATLDLDWALPADKSFMGEILMQLYTAEGKLAAEAGILDGWYSTGARAAAWIGEKRKGDALWLTDICDDPFIITRKGNEYTIHCGSWQLDGGKGTTDPIVTYRLIIRQYLYQGKDGKELSKFGRIAFKRLAVKDKALPRPAPRVAPVPHKAQWKVGKPIIGYWAGPEMSEAHARQLAEGGWNMAWGVNVRDLDIMHKYGIRGILWVTISCETPENQKRLAWWIESVRNHPAMYAVHCGDEPGNKKMDRCAETVKFFSKVAPEILHFNNMFPINASNKQLGHKGTAIEAYKAHIDEYCRKLKPQILCYDKYNFIFNGDDPSYFINHALIRSAALQRNIPQMCIVQGCSYAAVMRPPTGDEYRFLAYTSLAYGAQGLSNYVYGYTGHWGSALNPETGKTTSLYDAMKSINREFVAIATELQPLSSLAVWHNGTIPFGVTAYPDNASFTISPKIENVDQGLKDAKVHYAEDNNFFTPSDPVLGWILGVFGKNGQATHLLLVNVDYNQAHGTTFTAPGKLEQFDQFSGKWKALNNKSAHVKVGKGSGILFRLVSGSAPLLKNGVATPQVSIAPAAIKNGTTLGKKALLDDFTQGSIPAAWKCDYHRNCDGLKLVVSAGKGIELKGLVNAKADPEAWLARVTPFVSGDFICEMDLAFPTDAPTADNQIVFELGVPNGEPLIQVQISDGKNISAIPGWNGVSKFERKINVNSRSATLVITRYGDVFTAVWNGYGFFTGTGDIGPVGNFKIAVKGANSTVQIKAIRINTLK